jgi:CBS domain-containing protein
MTCHEIFKRLIELLGEDDLSLDVDAVYEQILSRDSCGITLPDPAVAVIHVRVEGFKQLRIAIGISGQGSRCAAAIEGGNCAAIGLHEVKLIVLILAPAEDPAGYLRAIAALLVSCHRNGFVERLVSLDDPELIWKAFEETNDRLPSYVKASDIMCRNFPFLHDTDALSDAIDAFCRLGVSEMPVVDTDGDLVGIVTPDELILICLPEYITWMEDLSPILNFEPFAEILRRESSVPVLEIMLLSDRYATVDEENPAIQVAKVMMRRHVRQVYVLREKRLVGVISIQDFIHKVLRA